MPYRVEWFDENREVYVHEAYDPNRFQMRARYTEEEKEIYRAKRNAQTPQENLRDLMRDSFLSAWKASDLAKWMDEFCPGYTVKRGNVTSMMEKAGVLIRFASLDHAMLFKLTWA